MADRHKTVSDSEKETLAFWRENDVFKKSLEQTRSGNPFVFFEGPPTANGRPGLHHVLARTYKDLFCRYYTMQGRYVLRKGGWDTHGLPVELEVEKELGLSSKQDIEEYGIAAFNERCRESVWTYKEEWERLTERMGFWIDLDDPYITYEPRYIETLWWIVKQIDGRGLLEKDFSIVPWCPRCGTSLSSHEVAQGYETVEDPAVTVKMLLKDDPDSASLLVWTTTPWTLLGNVAIAVHPDLAYVRARMGEEVIIVAKAALPHLAPNAKILNEMTGVDLVGREYSSPYTAGVDTKFSRCVVAADYVTAEDGTGLVHIAAFGEEDMQVIREHDLPVIIPVDEGGMVRGVAAFEGQFVKKADTAIIDDLDTRELLYDSAPVEHEYPFCWRCKTPLLYYPHESWFIRMARLRDELLALNDAITWEPAHTREGRFGEWLRELKDWNVSRERYWGTPLPVWVCGDCEEYRVVGAVHEFPEDTRNIVYLMRHGHTQANADGAIRDRQRDENDPRSLDEQGRDDVIATAEQLRDEGITKIVASPLRRAQETAQVMAKTLGVSVETDSRLQELSVGSFAGETWADYAQSFANERNELERAFEGGESRLDVQTRMVQLVQELNDVHEGERILLISHGWPLVALEGAMAGMSYADLIRHHRDRSFATAEWRPLTVRRLPVDENGRIDLHRPFVDGIVFPCSQEECTGMMQRTPEVMDAWFDSGSMPYAQWHYPFDGHGRIEGGDTVTPQQFPADFIAEGVDQTRGWFYTLLAVSALLGRGTAYRAAISLGLVLDEEGQKMSKSKGNVVDPWELFDEYGADATRWTLVTLNPAGEFKRFSKREVQDRQRRVLDTLRNTARFYSLYKPTSANIGFQESKTNVLDRWIISRLHSTTHKARFALDAWDATSYGRALETCIDDLSNWYVRRSRRRFQQQDDSHDYTRAAATLLYSLDVLARLTAPLAPFVAEEVYRAVHHEDDLPSVHLTSFPTPDTDAIDETLERHMQQVRQVASEALRLRAEHGISVRQPLATVRHPHTFSDDLTATLLDEINIKASEQSKNNVEIETELTEELRQEGLAREVARSVQSLRRKAEYDIADTVTVGMEPNLRRALGAFEEMVQEIAKAKKIVSFEDNEWDVQGTVTINDTEMRVGVKRQNNRAME